MFELRNPQYAVANVRNLSSVRRAMREYKKENPFCEWCGRTKFLHTHHIVSVREDPRLAGDKKNLITLCGKRCHITIGHFGNWKTTNPLVVATCNLGRVQ